MESMITQKLPNKRVDRLTHLDMLNMIDCYPKLAKALKIDISISHVRCSVWG